MLPHHPQNSSRGAPYLQTSPYFVGDTAGSEPQINQNLPPRPPFASQPHSRDTSLTRGRPIGSNVQPHGLSQAQNTWHASAPAQPSGTESTFAARAPTALETGLQRRTSNTYGHHRKTSVIHGMQHSRSPSFNSPATASPLSPESLLNASSNVRHLVGGRRPPGTAPDLGMTYQSPVSPLQGQVQTATIDSIPDGTTLHHDAAQAAPRKRNATSRTRRGHGQNNSNGQQSLEPRTPAQYALHHLFHAFVVRADQKIAQCAANVDSLITPVEQSCGPGLDPGFDQLIRSLGHISRQEPKPLVDSVMLWRKAKGDAAGAIKKQLNQLRLQGNYSANLPTALPRRHTEPVQPNGESSLPMAQGGAILQSGLSEAEPLVQEYQLTDRKATVSVYILCRVLIAIFEQSTISAISEELALKLEDIVFTQLKEIEPSQILNSSLRLANWRIYGQLLGHMSRIDFVHVTVRFIQQLDAWQQDVAKSSGTTAARDLEARIELLLLAMRNLHVDTSHEASYSMCEFLRALARLFAEAHGPRVKQAYCQLIERLLTPVAGDPECFQGIPVWKDFIETVNSRLGNMLVKVRHWNSGFPLSILLLCISPIETFSSQWLSTVSGLAPKLKDRSTRGPAMQAICQLTWSYLSRVSEPVTATTRKIEEVIRITVPAGKKTHIVTEPSVSDALVQLVRIIGFTNQDLCFRNIILPLVNHDIIQSSRDLKIEQLEPERMVIGIRSFLSIVADLEANISQPPFPTFGYTSQQIDGLPSSPANLKSEIISDSVRRPFNAQDLPSLAPVNTNKLDEAAKRYYLQFCEILGKITIICDNAFGGQATLNEKLSGLPPKTPLVDAFNLGRKEDGTAPEQRQIYYELLHVAIQALPRCFTDHIPLNTLINLLCTGSAHMQPNIATSATDSLKAIARQGYAQAVAIAFPRFIFLYDLQYSTMSDEGRLGPAHIESTLSLYLDLLHIWIDQLKQKAKGYSFELRDGATPTSARALQMEMTNVIPHVDEIEAYGFFFLCSQSRRVRTFSIKVLKLVTQFDSALNRDEPSRIIKLLESRSSQILDIPDDALSVAERSRLQKDKRIPSTKNLLIDMCSSEVSYDATLWFKAFPNLVRVIFEVCPNAIALSRGIVCDRLLLMQADVEAFARITTGSVTAPEMRTQGRNSATSPEVLFDQWKLYLIMACVTLSSAGAQSQSQLANAAHSRKTSKFAGGNQDKLGSARALFSAIIPMLAAGPESIRSAVVIALGSINRKLYRTLLESLQYAVITCNNEAKARINAHQRMPSSPSRAQMTERLRTEVTHVYKLTASFLRYEDIYWDEWILNNLVNYTKDLRIFLSDVDVQNDWRFQKLRFHYCGLIEEVFEGLNRTQNPARWIPFEARKSAFTLMEDWCGYSPEQNTSSKKDDPLESATLLPSRDFGNASAGAIEKEKNNLRLAALSSMAALCAGPISIHTESNALLTFNLPRMFSWIDTIFTNPNNKMHAIGQRALRLLLINNPERLAIMEHAIERCYRTENAKPLESYFGVVAEVLIQVPDYPLPFWKILGTVIFTLGNEDRGIRMKSAHLLRTLDERQRKSSNLEEFDISISDKTRAVYKLAQFEYSKRLSKAHPDLAFIIFSEFCLHYKSAKADHQRNIVAAILPWLQTLELQVDPRTGGPTALSYMLLANMFEITISSSSAMHNEVQALWQALATAPHTGNVQLILDFIIYLSLERREQNFVDHAKQIVVYLSSTLAGSRVLEFFLLQLTPKNMVNDKKNSDSLIPDTRSLPYAADLTLVLPVGNKQAGLSLGQVALIFLVDLMVPPVKLTKDQAIKLIHSVFILWDHYTSSVQDQAREMLVHLIHELVTTKVDSEHLKPRKQQIESLVEAVRKNEPQVSWPYENSANKDEDEGESRVPAAMRFLAKEIVDIFDLAFENFSDVWAKEALHWASICPVRHLACRSFQVFRSISVTLESGMLGDMLARLSNTIADEQTDYQTFSMEILTTLKIIIGALEPRHLLRYPQLFWTTCACLNTIHEREFFETLGMLEKLVEKLDLSDPHVTEVMLKGRPAKWEGDFEGLQPQLYKGLRSAESVDRTLLVLHKTAALPDCELIGRTNRLLFAILANMPRFLQQYDLDTPLVSTSECAQRLAEVASSQDQELLHKCLIRYISHGYSTSRAMLGEMINAIKTTYFPKLDARSLIFMIGLLTNKVSWFRVKVMEILCELIPVVDMKNPAITSHGPDLISPLLRLLQTEHCAQALEVMDHIMEVSGNPMERHHIRMSMASGSARAIRKEYERTKSLYGIPEASGWSIPMPAVYSSMTRNNVHAVFYTCHDSEILKIQEAETPEVEFDADDGYTESYIPLQEAGGTLRSIDTMADTNVSDLVHTLDSLDDFFDDPIGPDSAISPNGRSDSLIPSYIAAELQEHNTNLYDEQTAPILQRSLDRTSSSVSFQNGFTELTTPISAHTRAHPSTSSAGYASALQNSVSSIDELGGPGPSLPSSMKKLTGAPAVNTANAVRPGLHSRSITSPANQFQISQPTAGSIITSFQQSGPLSNDDGNLYYDDNLFSDTDNSPFPTLSATSANGIRNHFVPGPSIQSGGSHQTTPISASEGIGGFSTHTMRRGVRRLTGGKSESQREKEKVRDHTRFRTLSSGQNQPSGPVQSPRVPRVPPEYLSANNNQGLSPATSPAL